MRRWAAGLAMAAGAAALLLGTGGCGCGARKETANADATATNNMPTTRTAAVTPPAPRPAPLPPPPPLPQVEDIPEETATVRWTILPTGATIRVTAPDGAITLLEATPDASAVLATDFYDVDITHPDCEPWSKRVPLGGSVTNQSISLRLRKPEPATVAAVAPPDLATTIAAAEPHTESGPEPAATALVALTPPTPRTTLRPLTLETLEGKPSAPSLPTTPAAAETPVTVPAAPVPPERPAEVSVVVAPVSVPPTAPAVVAPAAPRPAPPVPRPPVVTIATPSAPAPVVAALPSVVRVVVSSTVPNDEAIAAAPKHLQVGAGDIRPVHGLTAELPRSAFGARPVVLRIARYDVTPLSQALPPANADGVAELRFHAVPHPVTVRLTDLPPNAEVWNLSGNTRTHRLSSASRPLLLTPFQDYDVEVRAAGYQPARLALRGTAPGEALPDVPVRLLPPPYSARPGQRCRIDLGNGLDLELVWVPGGRLTMTDPRFAGTPPDVTVATVPRGFWMAATEVSHAQWNAVMGVRGDEAAGGLPRANVAWDEANQFAQRLARLVPRSSVRLPSEPEWELAARGGYDQAATSEDGDVHCAPASRGQPRPATRGGENPLGLRNLLGNVREWCATPHGPYRGGVIPNPALRVVRGGGFRSPAADCRPDVRDAAHAGTRADDLGFRIVLQMSMPQSP